MSRLLPFLVGGVLAIIGQNTLANWVLGATAIVSAIPLVWDMIQDIRSGRYGIDILAATAIITSVLLGEFWAGMVIVLMLTGGEALEDYAENARKLSWILCLAKRRKKPEYYADVKLLMSWQAK